MFIFFTIYPVPYILLFSNIIYDCVPAVQFAAMHWNEIAMSEEERAQGVSDVCRQKFECCHSMLLRAER